MRTRYRYRCTCIHVTVYMYYTYIYTYIHTPLGEFAHRNFEGRADVVCLCELGEWLGGWGGGLSLALHLRSLSLF